MAEIKGLCSDDVEHAVDELKANCQCPNYWKDTPALPCPNCIVYDWYYRDTDHRRHWIVSNTELLEGPLTVMPGAKHGRRDCRAVTHRETAANDVSRCDAGSTTTLTAESGTGIRLLPATA